MSTRNRKNLVLTLAIALAVFMSGLGAGAILASPPSGSAVWDGAWIKNLYACFTSGLQLPFTSPGKLLVAGPGGNVTSTTIDVGTGNDLTGVDDINATDAHLSNLYANSAQLRDLYGKRLYDKVVIVTASGGNYTKLSDAFSAITDATSSKRYCILVIGNIADTAAITAKSYIDVQGYAADVSVTSNAAINSVDVGAIVYSNWNDVTFRRAGSPASGHHVLSVTGGDTTVQFNHCHFINELGGVLTTSMGVYQNAGSVGFIDCTAQGGSGGIACYGWRIDGTTTSILTRCDATGGSGDNYNPGFQLIEDCAPTLYNCNGYGVGDGSTDDSYGFFLGDRSRAHLIGCDGYGGVKSSGISVHDTFSGLLEECLGVGGSGATGTLGWKLQHACAPTLVRCVGRGGDGATGSIDFKIIDNAAPNLVDCVGEITKQAGANWPYDDANSGRFQPYASHPYQVITLQLGVNVGNAGVTVDIGTTAGGSQVASAIPITTVGSKNVAIVQVSVAAGGYLYATPSAPIADGDITIYYTVARDYSSCWSLYMSTTGFAKVSGGQFCSTGSSDAMYIDSVSVTNKNWMVTNAEIRPLNYNRYAIQADSAITAPPIFGCVIYGRLSNITPNGSNVFSKAVWVNSGSATLLSGQNHVHVTHGLSYTPSINDIQLTLNGPYSNCTAIWVDPSTITSTEFQVFCGTTSQKNTDANILFSWSSEKP